MALISFTVLYLFLWCFCCSNKYCCLYAGVVRLRVGPVVQTDQPLAAPHSQAKHSIYFSIILFVMNSVQLKRMRGNWWMSNLCELTVCVYHCQGVCVRAYVRAHNYITIRWDLPHKYIKHCTLEKGCYHFFIFHSSVAWLMEHYSHHIGAVSGISCIFLCPDPYIYFYISQPFLTARSVGQGEGCG